MPTKIAPCLWFDGQAEEAAEFYVSIFRNARIKQIARYGEAGQEITGQKPGSVMTVVFELDGQEFTGLNGGPTFQFSEAISFQVFCEDQAEIDYYWEKLGEGGPVEAQVCGWVKDKYGVSWQIVPRTMGDLVGDDAPGQRAMAAMLRMKKLDIAALQRAREGN
jgi:predicted 3-demethylubiquinone-9 3-methyltransferase (glyoxalase superfamily)